ncbi:MAG: flippase-like domain-containing protein [Thermoanaerobaculia bacterium]|nr:flippase-like domain-containing protein [Thermoanaerobaculia bacterium]
MNEQTSQPSRWKRLARRWRLVVGLGLLGSLVHVVGPGELLAVFSRASPGLLFLLVVLLAVWLLLGAANVWILLRSLKEIPFLVFLRVYAVSWATSLLLPGQLGDSTQVLFLRRYDVPMASSGAAYLIDKALSLFWMLAVAAAGLGHYASFPWTWIAGLMVAGVIGVVSTYGLWRSFSRRSWGRLESARIRISRLAAQGATFRHRRGVLMLNSSNTILKWVLLTWIYQVAFAAFDQEIGWFHAATYPVVSSLVGYLPITAGGAGTMEWTAVALFGSLGVPAVDVLAAYLVLRAILIGSAFGVLALVRLA